MNKFIKLAITSMAIMCTWACVDNANLNKPANTNANANSNANATASKAAPTVDALMALEKQANDAYVKGDGQFFQGYLSDKFVMNEGGKRYSKADTVKMISDVKCESKSVNLDEPKMSMIDADTYAVVYKNTTDATCTYQGQTEKMQDPMRSATVWTRNGDKWEAVWHGETKIVDPSASPAKSPATASSPAAKSNSNSANTNSTASANSNTNSNSNSSAAPAADPSIDAMVAVEKSGWEAWKSRDAAKFEPILTANASFVDLFGKYSSPKAEVIKEWTSTPCEIKSTSVTDTSGQMLSPTAGVITFKGSADGTCSKMKIQPVWGTSFYVKEGDAWKLAFGFENPA
jgi:hypothetical protein